MLAKNIFDEISDKVQDIIHTGPAKDIEKNIKAVFNSAFSKMDLVTREESDIQQQMLQRACEQLLQLEDKINQLEEKIAQLEINKNK